MARRGVSSEDSRLNVMLVKSVSRFPVLYSKNRGGRVNRRGQKEAWERLARDMKLTVDICQKRWKCIRAAYGKHLREGQLRGARPYYLARHLRFLEPHMNNRKYVSNDEQKREGVVLRNERPGTGLMFADQRHNGKPGTDIGIVISFQQQPGEMEENEMFLPPPPEVEDPLGDLQQPINEVGEVYAGEEVRQVENNGMETSTVVTDVVRSSPRNEEQDQNEDEDMLFLRSLAPDVKKLPPAMKMEWKVASLFTLYQHLKDQHENAKRLKNSP